MTTKTKRQKDPDPKVLEQLAQLAAIRDSPYERIVLPDGQIIPTTTRKKFDRKIIANIYVAQFAGAMMNAELIRTRKAICKHAHALIKHLKASNEKYLSEFLASGWTVDAYIRALNDLAETAQQIDRIANARRPGKSKTVLRSKFVELLLDAAADAGGKLTLDRSNDSGSLVKAVALLQPYLPKEYSEHLSFASLRRIREAWRKKRKNR